MAFTWESGLHKQGPTRDHGRTGEGGVCSPNSTPPPKLHPRHQKKTQTGWGGYSSRGGSQTTEPPDLLKLPYPALDHFHPLGGPRQDLDRQQLRVRRGHQMDTIQTKTARRGRYADKQPGEGAMHSSPLKLLPQKQETTWEQLLIKKCSRINGAFCERNHCQIREKCS